MSLPADSVRFLQMKFPMIEDEGISVAAYMQFALNDNQQGYYRHVEHIGRGGDFVTAPHITSLYGEVIGAWLVNRWHQLGRPDRVDLVELGPGQGLLLKDILSVCQMEPDLIYALQNKGRIKCLEINPHFRASVIKNNSAYSITFYDDFYDILDPGQVSLIVAHEFFDALPIHQFVYVPVNKTEYQWCARKIKLSGTVGSKKLQYTIDHNDLLSNFLIKHDLPSASFCDSAQSYQTLEINVDAFSIMNCIANHLTAYGGGAIVCDYGNSSQVFQDTLQAVYDHRPIDVLDALMCKGDITAHVDFYRLSQHLHTHHRLSSTLQTQRQFLIDNGIMQRAIQLKNHLSTNQLLQMDQALHRLISPAQMGILFKVLCLH